MSFSEIMPYHTRSCDRCLSEEYPGIRYSCKTCADFNLCERCYIASQLPSSTHYIETHINSHEINIYEPERN